MGMPRARHSRRQLLRLGFAGGIGLTLPDLLRLRTSETKLLAVFQFGDTADKVRVFRWALDGDTPVPQPKAEVPITGPTKLISTPILGGLHHRYQRVAA